MSHPLAKEAASALERLRDAQPRVHCITNAVAQPLTANGLLALGAIPSLTANVREIADFVSNADALLINIGMLDPERISAIDMALEISEEDRTPFVLDPVFVDVSPLRCDYAMTLVGREPGVIRLNAAELVALAKVESPDPQVLALDWLTVIAMTGDRDRITDGSQSAVLGNGAPVMAKVTAVGCLASALVAAFLPVTKSPFLATIAGLGVSALAGELAASKSKGPGTFAVNLLDALADLTPGMLMSRLDIENHES